MPGWTARVNQLASHKGIADLRRYRQRDFLLGSTEWVEESAGRTGTWATKQPISRLHNTPKSNLIELETTVVEVDCLRLTDVRSTANSFPESGL
jgi:hypothetical protein